MSFLSEIHAYWLANSTLNTALPASKVYTGLAPESLAFPYAVVVSIGLVPTYTTCTAYVGTFAFQISVYDTDPDNVEALASTITGQFDYQSISANTMYCLRTNGPILLVEPETPANVYHGLIEFELMENRTLPSV